MLRRVACLGAVAVLLTVGLVGSAQAVQYGMKGTWKSNRGPQIYIPVLPGPPCQMGAFLFCADGPVTAAGLTPGAQVTLPANRFYEMGGGVLAPVPGPTVVQLTTMIEAMGPAFPAVFKGGPKTSRPANFAWCPGATQGLGTTNNPNCTTGKSTGAGANAGNGVRPGRIRYTKGPNQFGGVAQALLKGGGSVTVFIGGTPMSQMMLHNPFGGAATSNDQEAGGAYQNTGSVMLASGDITIQTVTMAGQGKATTGGVITMKGAAGGMGGPETNYTTGFPFTTGKVQATNPTTGMGRGTTMLTLTGMDAVTGMGGRNIVMVASAITKRIVAGTSYMHLDVMNLTLTPLVVPSLTRGGFAAAAVVVLAAGYMLRRRLA
jgi:hypothetical protein